MTYRTAHAHEADTIAQLHAKSWQTAYRGMLSDDFLDNQVLENRLNTWRKRFETPSVSQQIFVAEEAGEVIGFACIYAHDDTQWGALIDNLHVLPEQKGKGIGKKLMDLAAEWVKTQDPEGRYYLWVLADNVDATAFYERIGGQKVEDKISDLPDGGQGRIFRMAWI
jgi:GNAT superfamily N-acetyltransferase